LVSWERTGSALSSDDQRHRVDLGQERQSTLLLYGGVGFDEVRQLADDINVTVISRTRSHWKSWMLEKSRS
jgi:hypothetical protein